METENMLRRWLHPPLKGNHGVRNCGMMGEQKRRAHLRCQTRGMSGSLSRVCFNNMVVCKRTWMACQWKHCGILPVTTSCLAATSINSERDISLGVVLVPQHVCIQSLLKPLRASALPAELGKQPDTCHPAPSGSCLSGTWTCCRIVSMWAGSRLHPQTCQRSNSGFHGSFFLERTDWGYTIPKTSLLHHTCHKVLIFHSSPGGIMLVCVIPSQSALQLSVLQCWREWVFDYIKSQTMDPFEGRLQSPAIFNQFSFHSMLYPAFGISDYFNWVTK